jgi:hypothetical protein
MGVKSDFQDFFRKNFCYGIVPPIEGPVFALFKGGYGSGGGGQGYPQSGGRIYTIKNRHNQIYFFNYFILYFNIVLFISIIYSYLCSANESQEKII